MSIELRHGVGTFHGQLQAVAFLDSARITINRNPWTSGANSAVLNGVGVGLNWAGPDMWHARAYVASRAGSAPVVVANSGSGRAWVEIGKGF